MAIVAKMDCITNKSEHVYQKNVLIFQYHITCNSLKLLTIDKMSEPEFVYEEIPRQITLLQSKSLGKSFFYQVHQLVIIVSSYLIKIFYVQILQLLLHIFTQIDVFL